MKSPNFGNGKRVVDHGNGKGDADRTTDSKAYQTNINAIPLAGLRPGERFRKVYGTPSTKPERTGPHIRIK